jgi:ferrous iron transport protein B
MSQTSTPTVPRSTPLIALVGNPNCGKTALFNRLTGSRQKVGNYAGVTVERKEGQFISPQGQPWRVLDLPGAYSLLAVTPDEAVTRDVIAGTRDGETTPVGLVCVVDATNLRLNLRMVLELQTLGVPMVLAINMMDLAARRGIHIDTKRLQAELGIPVVEAVAVRAGGEAALLDLLDGLDWSQLPAATVPRPMQRIADTPVEQTHRRVSELLASCVQMPEHGSRLTAALDRYALHPVFGPIILAALMFLVFQAVFSWANAPMDWIDASVGWVADQVKAHMADGMLRSLLVEGVIGGAGSVLIFLPQIVILFGFILALEDSGYLLGAAAGVRAADRGFHPPPHRGWRVQPARPGAVCPVHGGHRVGHAGGPGAQAPDETRRRPAPAAGAARLPRAPSAQPGAGPVGACAHLRAAGGRGHPVVDDHAVVPVELPRRA